MLEGLMIRCAFIHSQRINDPMKKWTNELNRAFSKEEVQMAKQHMKKCSTSLVIKKIKIIKILPYLTNSGKNVGGEEKKPSYTIDGNVN
jgi:hypothetical protein